MTVIGAVLGQDGYWIGADSMVTRSEGICGSIGRGKFVEYGGVTCVVAGSLRVRDVLGAALREAFEGVAPGPRELDHPQRLSARWFVEVLQEKLWEPGGKNGSPFWDMSLLLTDGHVLLEVEPTLGITFHERGEPAFNGVGREAAYAAAHAVERVSTAPGGEVLRIALLAACHVRVDCGKPVFVEHVPHGQEVIVP